MADDQNFYIRSLSDRVISYKGLVMLQISSISTLTWAMKVLRPQFVFFTVFQRIRFRWPLAQPFRMLAHNGEINTIEGNRNWSKARTPKLSSPLLPDLHSVAPLVNESGSDSSSLDNMLELLVTGGVELPKALRMLIPPAWQNIEDIDPDLKAFYQYHAMHMEPWTTCWHCTDRRSLRMLLT